MNDETNKTGGTGAESGTEKPESAAAETGTAGEAEKESAAASREETASMTPDEVAAMIRSAFADFAKQQEKAKTEAEKLAGMNDQQRVEYERDSYKTQLEELNRKIALSEMQSAARSMLAEKNIHASDGIVERLVTDNAETTKQNVEEFSKLFSDAVEAAVKERLKGETPRRGTPASKMTKEQILAIKDDPKRIQAIRENIELFQ